MNKRLYLIPVLIIITSIAFGCLDKNVDPDLKQRIEAYYKFEKENNWEKTYNFRTPLYRSGVPKEIYIKTMTRDMEGWTLDKFKIKDYKIQNNFAEVEILFIERQVSKGINFIPNNRGIFDVHVKYGVS